MKKFKEFLLFIIPLSLPIILFFVSCLFVDIFSNYPRFMGVVNYIRMFADDKLFGKALFNTFFMPMLVSLLALTLFALVIFFLRKKIKSPRRIFYLGGILIGAISAAIFIVCRNMALAAEFGYVGDSLSVFSEISLRNLLTALYIGIFTAFVFWILELICYIIKFINKKRNNPN